MALIKMDGFDSYDNLSFLQKGDWRIFGNSSNITVDNSAGRFGGTGIICNRYGRDAHWGYRIDPEVTNVRVAASVNIQNTTTNPIFDITSTNGNFSVGFNHNNSAVDLSFNNDTDVSGAFNLSTGWHWMEVEANHGASGSLIVRIDGTEVYNQTHDLSDGSGFASVQFGGYHNTVWDDVVIWDNSGTTFNTFPLGDSRIETTVPAGSGSSTDFTPSTGNNWENVDELPTDRDTTYNESSVLGNRDLFTVTSLPTLDDVSTIRAVQVRYVGRTTSPGPRQVAPVLKSGTTIDVGSAKTYITEYSIGTQQYVNNPDTGSSWTESEVNNLEVGYEISS